MKALYIEVHEELVDKMIEETGCTWEHAYDACAEPAFNVMRDRLADMVDAAKDRRKYDL